MSVAHENQSQDGEDDVSLTQFTLAPFVQLVFPGESVRPFVGASVSLSVLDADAGEVDTNLTLFGFSGNAGLHWFVAPSVSFAPSLAIAYAFGSQSAEAGALAVDSDANVLAVALGLSLCAWL